MLDKILSAMVDTYRDRANSQTAYSGWGTTIDRMVDEYWEVAGWTPETRRMIHHLERLAYTRAMGGT